MMINDNESLMNRVYQQLTGHSNTDVLVIVSREPRMRACSRQLFNKQGALRVSEFRDYNIEYVNGSRAAFCISDWSSGYWNDREYDIIVLDISLDDEQRTKLEDDIKTRISKRTQLLIGNFSE